MKLTGQLLALAVLAAGCATTHRAAASDPLIGAWIVTGIDGQSAPGADAASLTFAETGQVSGDAGCNRFIGAYSLTPDAKLVVTPLALTRKFCGGSVQTLESQIVARLQAARDVTIRSDGAVQLAGPEGQLLIQRRGKSAAMAPSAPALPGAQAPLALPAPAAAQPSATIASAPVALPPPSTTDYGLAGGPSGTSITAPGAAPLYAPPVEAPTPTVAPAQASALSPPLLYPAAPAAPLPASPAVVAAPAPAPRNVATSPPATVVPPLPPAQARIVADGAVIFSPDAPLPPGAQMRVQLRATPRSGGRITVLAQLDRAIGGAPPFPFHLEAPTAIVPSGVSVGIVSQISAGGRVMFISGGETPVSPPGQGLTVKLVPVAGSALSPAAPAPLSRPVSSPAPVPAAPVPPKPVAAAQPGPLTSVGRSYRCGGDRISVQTREHEATIAAGDAASTVPRIDVSTDPSTPRMFSNGVLTLIEDADGARVRFARGRAPLTACSAE